MPYTASVSRIPRITAHQEQHRVRLRRVKFWEYI